MTEEYTPTTEQVREAYEMAHELTGAPLSDAEFDRWLAKHDAEVLRKAADDFGPNHGVRHWLRERAARLHPTTSEES